ncbi:L-asparaginase, type II [Penicillium expansum]|uniref:asparaginase n=1 Tax=Penicillium expansum TaxID=27334 RepID=A0A0A2KAM8_PENEN|nr:L-asparaginase, type II [Penicillium expansum]KGO61415.1 L-asparaginase, type II [Penicillium expansum]
MGSTLQTLAFSALAITSYASPLIYPRAANTSYTNSNGLTFNHFDNSLPNITILATGGTIAGTSDDKTATAGYKSGALGINTMLSGIPDIFNVANIAAVQAHNVNSGDISSSLLLNLTHTLQTQVCDDPTMSGAVITHGTDTLEESAFFIDATVNCGKPIVFVGSMRPSTALSADGPMNLLQGVTVAADKNSRDRGALVVVNDRIVSALFATKTNANTMDTFKAYEQGSLGFIVSNKPYFYYPAVQANAKHVVDVSDVDAVPRVDILYAYEDMQVDSIYSAVKNGAKGIVIAGEGAGGVSTEFASAINDIGAKHRIPVVLSHRTVNGEVPTADLTGANAETKIASGMFNPQQSRVLLGLLLAEKKGLKEIREVFLKATVA